MSDNVEQTGDPPQIPVFNDNVKFDDEKEDQAKVIHVSLSTPSPIRVDPKTTEGKPRKKRRTERTKTASLARSRSRDRVKRSRGKRTSRSRDRSTSRKHGRRGRSTRVVRSRSARPVKIKKRVSRRHSVSSSSISPERHNKNRAKNRSPGYDDRSALAAELTFLFNSRSNRPPDSDSITVLADLFVDSGFAEMAEIKNASRQLREFFISDLREKRVALPIIKHCVAVLDFHPCDFKRSAGAKRPTFEEVDIAGVMRSLSTSWAMVAPSITPDQAMVNFFSKELAIGKAHNPPFVPYVVSPLNIHPWLPQSADQLQRADTWKEKMKRIQSAQEAPFPARAFLRLRFIFAGEVAAAWSDFGGLAAQLSHLLFCAEMATLINTEAAMLYNKLLSQRLAAAARARNPDRIDYIAESALGNEILKQRAVREQASDYSRRTARNSGSKRDQYQSFGSQTHRADKRAKGGGRKGKSDQKGKGKQAAPSPKTPQT